MARPTIWLLSAYASASHRVWADGLVANQSHVVWRRLELPGRHFRWRIRGNPLSWMNRLPDGSPDLVLATSMVDLATLKGLHPRLARVPAYYYFHENQFAYPVSDRQFPSVDPQMVQLYGALAAQQLLFNSGFNRDSFLQGVEALLRAMPDHAPRGVTQTLQEKSVVLPVPVEPIAPAAEKDERLILWNHRWEYDKAPELFVSAVLDVAAMGIDFRLALLGARPRDGSGAIARLREALPDRVVADGEVETARYRCLLSMAGIVVSTARQEFQGLAVLEAASAGARPLVPNALCYPEQYPSRYRYPPGDRQALVGRLTEWLTAGLPAPVDVSPWSSQRLSQAWRTALIESPYMGTIP